MVKKITNKLSSRLKQNRPELMVVFLSTCWYCRQVCHFASHFCAVLTRSDTSDNTESLFYFSWLRRVHDVITVCTWEPVLIIIQQSRN